MGSSSVIARSAQRDEAISFHNSEIASSPSAPRNDSARHPTLMPGNSFIALPRSIAA
jgi:hypothetical protein